MVLDALFKPLLGLDPLITIIGVSLAITIVSTLAAKYTTDQKRIKQLKERSNELRKDLRNKEIQEDKEKFAKLFSESNAINLEMMRNSMRPMLFTMLPILIVFAWLSGHLAYEPIQPGDIINLTVFTIPEHSAPITLTAGSNIQILNSNSTKTPQNGQTNWLAKADRDGRYILKITSGTNFEEIPVLVTNLQEYESTSKEGKPPFQSITLNMKKLTPLGNLSLFGWKPGWLAIYFITSIVFNIIFRKVMKVH